MRPPKVSRDAGDPTTALVGFYARPGNVDSSLTYVPCTLFG